jgi:hypothetical protein
VNAYDFEVDGIYYNILSASDRTVEVTQGALSYAGGIIIPEFVKFNNIEFSVTQIGHGAFSRGADDNLELTSVILPNSLVSIGSGAFSYCKNIKTITIPEGVTIIQDYTFSHCISLEEIKLASKTEYIGEYAFCGCGSLKPFDFPESLRSIGNNAFNGCESLKHAKLPGDLFIGESSFRHSVEMILLKPFGVFEFNDYSIDYFPFDNSTTFILRYEEMSYDYTGDGIEDILPSYQGYGWLYNHFNFLTYDFSFTDAEIDYILETGGRVMLNGVEYRVSSLRNAYTMEVLSCDNGFITADITSKINYLNREFIVTSIKESAFANNTTLKTIKIPSSIESIGKDAFAGCTSISTVITESTTPLSINEGCFDAMAQLFATLYVPTGTVDTYKTAPVWKGFGNITDARISYNTLALKTNAGGTITCEGVSVSDATERVYTINSSVEITFTPHKYYTLAKVLVDGIDVSSDVRDGVLSINVNADTEIEAIFDSQSEILLQDEQSNFELDFNISCDKITYIRHFDDTQWQALYLPFAIPYDSLYKEFEVAYINDMHQFDDDNNGTIDRTEVEAIKIVEGTLKANYPYLIKAKSIGEKSIVVADATLYATEENSVDCSSVFTNYTFTGSYSTLSGEELAHDEGYYVLSDGMWQPLAEGASLGAFRIYLKIESRDGNNAILSQAAIRMRVVGDEENEDDAAGIENSTGNGQQATVYDLQGRKVLNTDNLKGIYIVDGKKVVIK